jgi:hypothetical protein
MRIIASKYLIPKGFSGLTLYPFIILRDKKLRYNQRLLNHEKIHLRQQAEMLVLPFYFCYFLEYIVRLIQYRNTHRAYRNISFEREAYLHENDTAYLGYRQFWNFTKFL